MAIYITETAAQNALVQEAAFYPDDQTPLSSVLLKNNRTLTLINMGKGASLKLGRDNNTEAVRILHIALFTVIPEMNGVSPQAKDAALSLKWGQSDFGPTFVGEFAPITEWLVNYFQENTAELAAEADGIVGRKTVKELDNALNRIGGYDEINGGTIINYGLAEYINKDTVISNTYSGVDYVPLYSEPIPDSNKIKLRLKKGDIVHVLRKHPATAAGWYQVIVISANKNIQTAAGKDELTKAYTSNVSIEGHIEAAYIWEYWETPGPGEQYKAPMPDMYSKLYRIPAKPVGQTLTEFSNQQLKSIIQENYYDEVKIYPINSDGEAFDPTDPANYDTDGNPLPGNPDSVVTFTNTHGTLVEDSAYFRFCLNLLIYANNPDPQNDGHGNDKRSIYPKAGKKFFTKTDHDSAYLDMDILLSSGTTPTSLYQEFIDYVIAKDPSGGYNYINNGLPDGQKIEVLLQDTGNYFMWVPSRQCAESLWRMVDQVYTDALPVDDPVVQLSEYAIEAMFPARSLGARFKVELGATYAFIGADFVGDVSMWRQDTENPNTHIIKISAYGELRLGADVGTEAGFGYWSGGNNRKRKRPGIGAAIGASAQLQQKVTALVEFEIPITGRDPLSRGLGAMMYAGVGALLPITAPFAFYRAADNFNLDIWNYMTKLKVYTGIYGSAGAQASIGFQYGNTNDMPDWQTSNVDNKYLNAIKFPSLLSGAALSAGAGINGEFGFGFDIDVKYYVGSDYQKCMRADGTRIPLEVKAFAFGEGQLHGEFFTSLSKGMIGIPILPGFLLNQGLGIKVGIIYNIADQVTDNDTSNFDFTFNNLINQSKKIISIYNFAGDLDRYLEYGYEATYNFDMNGVIDTIIGGVDPSTIKPGVYVHPSYNFGDSLQNVLNQLDGAEFKKRFNLGYVKRKYRSMLRAQRIVGERWHEVKSKYIGGKSIRTVNVNSYLDLNYTIRGEDYIKAVKSLAIMVQIGVAIEESPDTSELAILFKKLETFLENGKSLDERIDYAITLYNDAALTTILANRAPAAQVFYTLLNMTAVEIGNRTGFYKSNATSLSTVDARIKDMVLVMAINYVSKWKDITLSMHNEAGGGFATGGSLGFGAKVRAFIGIEYAIIMHSDFIKDDYVFNTSFWAKIMRSLFDIDPTTLPGGEILREEDKEKLAQILFDKQL
ncbi:hypothetical protein KORDIASMS9_04512 [Kordia sp. SMS9]|uniref:hypothetical protein n=1 Tax=Kordia sp. SMS9 TaxID=2282170 RepID=UPI000E0D2E4D|nr:hypothetical protein [Kordia sp. SMS9]AXG72244.1 hypothetical protein KORDIASMS9_04512 [Kordia sp. SMS9]